MGVIITAIPRVGRHVAVGPMHRHTGVVLAVLQAVTIIARRVVAPIVQDTVTRRVSIIVKELQVDY